MLFFQRKWPAILLWPFSLIYSAVVSIRNYCYDRGIFKSFSVSCQVISVGNITVGGTGKTPTVITLARELQKQGNKVCILSRGYGRTSKGNIVVSDGNTLLVPVEQAGDEPWLMSNALPSIPVIVDQNRVNGARVAMHRFNPDIIILDDGYQHRRLKRDLDIVTFNSSSPVGNGMVLPAGPLREPLNNLERGHIFWINGNDKKKLPKQVTNTQKPVINAQYQPIGLFNQTGNMELSALKDTEIIAFSGLGNPENFKTSLKGMGAQIKLFKSFKDHYNYTQQDIQYLIEKYNNKNVSYIITTEKDWVKLPLNLPQAENWFFLKIDIVPELNDFVSLIKSVSKSYKKA